MMRYRIPSYIDFRIVHDEIVLLDTRTDRYSALNPTAALIWTTLSEEGTLQEAVTALTTQFGIADEVATTDVQRLLNDLLARGLLEQVNA